MARNNQKRTRASSKKEASSASSDAPASLLNFVTPTEFVELPSKGRFYPEGHAFHNKETIEIRYMTAKDEDILTNQALLRKGVALERLLESILSNNDVDPSTLLVGDRNAIIVAARSTGYGASYNTTVNCPSCLKSVPYNFSLSDATVYEGDKYNKDEVTFTDTGTFVVQLPITKINVEMRLLTGEDETSLTKSGASDTLFDNILTSQVQRIIVALNDETDTEIINKFVEVMPAYDSRYLREAHNSVTPNIDLTQQFVCPECSYEQKMGVPFTADFFWPKR